MSTNLRRSERLRDKQNDSGEASHETADVKSQQNVSHSSFRSNTSAAVRRQKLEAELEFAQKKNELDELRQKAHREEEEMLRIQKKNELDELRRKAHREEEMLKIQLALKMAKIDEDNFIEQSECIRSHLQKHYIARHNNPDNDTHIQDSSEKRHTYEQFMSRQSLSKDLPVFSGDPMEWPNFISQYRNTTRVCGFSDEENQARLQKCLRGKAKEVVQALLILPQNVTHIIETLEKRFGRPEYIISNLLEKILKLTPIKEDKFETIIDFSDNVKNFVCIIQTLNEEDHLRNPLLLQELINKLPLSYRMNWAEYMSCKEQHSSKLVEFQLWLERKADAACQLHIPKYVPKSDKTFDFRGSSTKREASLTTTEKRNKVCVACKKEIHHLSKCSTFQSLDVEQRWKLVTTNHVCFSCLCFSHNIKACRYRKDCGINGCRKPHHILLHKDYDISPTVNSQPISQCQPDNGSQVNRNCYIGQPFNKVLLKVLPVILKGPQGTFDTYALLDDASTVTLLDEAVANKLGISGNVQSLCLQWTNDKIQQDELSKIVSLGISGPGNRKSFHLRHVRTIKNLSLPTQTIDFDKISIQYPHLKNVGHNLSMVNAKPTILIGQDNWPLLLSRKIVSGPWDGPAVSKTLLGWSVHGNTSRSDMNTFLPEFICLISHQEKDDMDLLHDLVKAQWKLDSFGVNYVNNRTMSKEDLRAQMILNKTLKRIGDRFEIGLLWRKEDVQLPESKTNAFKRLKFTERKMDRDPIFSKAYCNKMDEYIQKDYLRKLSMEETAITTNTTWYLPHFGVTNPNKPNKIRIVFDAAAKSNDVSLNDQLLPGPDLYNSLPVMLLNFRIKNVAFAADIKEMFLQVRVRKEDRSSQRLLWRGMDRAKEPDIYEIQVVFFGSVCGPCLAQTVKNKNASEHHSQYPEAAKAILDQHYMDDYLGTAEDETEALKLINEVIAVHKKGGFVICNWICNSRHVLRQLDPSLIAYTEKDINIEKELPTERILGLWWNPDTDIFSFQTKFHKIDTNILNGNRRPTKREILKVIMSIFDPLGFISQILLQEIWRSGIGWDDELTDNQDKKWKIWLEDLQTINTFRLPRQYSKNFKYEVELHIFCDASENAYASVAYLRWKEDDIYGTAFVIAKSRVSPLKPMSIPRLELQAALMGARLGSTIRKDLKLNFTRTYYWSDSKTVLYWIKSEARRFKVFIAHRLGEIQELTNSDDWFYVNSKDNVADEATKKIGNFDFTENSRWLKGPNFLLSDKYFLQTDVTEFGNIQENDLEERSSVLATVTVKESLPTPDPVRFSKWLRLVRTTAWTLRFIYRCKTATWKNESKVSYELQPKEITNAELLLYRRVQEDCFPEELRLLRNNKILTKCSRIYTLTPFLDSDNLMRLLGRLDNATIIDDFVKRPIILDSKHPYVKLLIQHSHEQSNHYGKETVINNLRQRYWILNLRQTIKRIFMDCQKCKNRKAIPQNPVMGQLPLCRLEPTSRPFVKTGVDMFGPMEVLNKRRHEKRYGVIFTCMTVRAIHVELAQDLSTNAFIHAFRQFGCRRGFPDDLFCDNGTNFRGADREIKEAMLVWKQDDITRECSLKKTTWHFNPPLAPHMGGTWERLIQSIKKNLKEVLKEKFPQEYVLRTLLVEVENIINSRPLMTPVSLDHENEEMLTPNHFLIGKNYVNSLFVKTDDKDLHLINKWRAVQRLTDIFWKRWATEYLPTLVKKTKWFETKKPLQVGDVVLMVDPNGPRNVWPKGKVTTLYPGKDGHVRVVDVKTVNGIYRRAVHRLVVLDVNKSN